ncbi:MAG: hypothetical protein K1060chlam3_00175 [Candidatus Anoxychlamydiales bacterium]|nr:hypothetical protein [Candidatus Anoxychlamydiales bacterium]
MSSVTSTTELFPKTLPMPPYIQFLSKVPFKALPITSILLLSASYLLTDWKITAFKLAAIGFGSGSFLPAIGIAKNLINPSKEIVITTITAYDKENFLPESLFLGCLLGSLSGIVTFALASHIS